jgi:hypothetical protein
VSEQAQQAIAADDGYLQAVAATLATPVGTSSSNIQTLSTGAQTAMVALNTVVAGAGSSIGGSDNLLSWVAGATGMEQSQSSASVSQSASSSQSVAASSSAASAVTDCGGGLTAGPNTSCAFAENVQQAYSSAPGLVATVQAYSPVTGQTYSMSCAPAGAGVTCSGANDASVSWGD